jgi:hypothetical protein
MQQDSGKGGGGVVMRDHSGRFLAGACHFFPSLLDLEDTELQACKRAMDMAKVLKLKKIVLESNSLMAVSKLNK